MAGLLRFGSQTTDLPVLQEALKIYAQGSGEDGLNIFVNELFVMDNSSPGVPDGRNIYNYLIDLDDFSAVHIEAYSAYVQTLKIDGNKILEFMAPEYTSQGRREVKVWYDLNGNKVKTITSKK